MDLTEFTVLCSWCRREVISFVAPPAMIEVTIDSDWMAGLKSVDRICALCHIELVKLIAQQADLVASFGDTRR
jgi:hypothetical protein